MVRSTSLAETTTMAAMILAMLRDAGRNMGSVIGFRRRTHFMSLPPPLGGAMDHGFASTQLVLPEFDAIRNNDSSRNNEFIFPSFSFGGSMELMAVPKRKVSPHKRGIRNGPKALKPTPVIVRCKSCGRVKLPHFYCCSGHRGNTEQNESTS
ncbi:Ribosomal protein L32 [Quillaja saponaria]|uniref:Large ribosomal subunit protein bL32m n=1 Tax=Quillaja saponaria TaxID=32244 RepID=A0AAD7LAM2_QUISA|nr:Ribosomal protein L32 [Quillaja saponaria]